MPIVSMRLFKLHTRTDDFTEDDEYLQSLLAISESVVVEKIGYTEDQIRAAHGGEVPLAATQAVLLLAGYWYGQREAVTMANAAPIPFGIDMLITSVYRSTKARLSAGGDAPGGAAGY